MQDFQLYFSLGWHHILDWEGYDHILFLLALCSVYNTQDLKKLLILITAFTLGHSITLALSVGQYIHINSKLIEFLIPVTILITAFSNIISKKKETKKNVVPLFADPFLWPDSWPWLFKLPEEPDGQKCRHCSGAPWL